MTMPGIANLFKYVVSGWGEGIPAALSGRHNHIPDGRR
jgi:hypothetical protein